MFTILLNSGTVKQSIKNKSNQEFVLTKKRGLRGKWNIKII